MATSVAVTIARQSADIGPYVLITAAGEIDESNLAKLSSQLDPLAGAEEAFILLDLAQVTFINSKVIGYLAGAHTALSENNRHLIFISPSEPVAEILELVGLPQIVPTFQGKEAALRAIRDNEFSAS